MSGPSHLKQAGSGWYLGYVATREGAMSERLEEHLELAGFIVMKRPEEIGAAALGRGCEG